MANPTSNFGWQMPTNTDLVKDLPADFEVFGQAVDTSMADLKGGTTGQILSKNSNTDMDFTWITNDVGDITAVTAGTGLSGGGTSGAVSLSIDSTVATLTGSQTLTNKTISASSNTISGVINNTLTTTTGDLIYASSANTPARLGIGSSNQVLTVSGGVPTWATPAASSSGLTKITSQSFSNSNAINLDSVFSSTYRNYRIILNITSMSANSSNVYFKFRSSGSTDSSADHIWQRSYGYINTATSSYTSGQTYWSLGYFDPGYSNTAKMMYGAVIDIFAPYTSGTYTQAYATYNSTYGNTPETGVFLSNLWKTVTTSWDGFAIQAQGSDGFYGVVKVYGYQD